MYKKLIQVLFAVVILHYADCKRTKPKKLTSDTEQSTPKPSVLTYSTFGFNDVGQYDGFVPTSPDYATFLTGNKQESSTRLYAPAFPTNLDSSGFGDSYGTAAGGLPLQISDEQLQTSMSKYQPGSINFFTSSSFDNVNDPNTNKFISDSSYDQIDGDQTNSPIYGAKLNSKQRNKLINDYNNSEYNASKDEPSNVNMDAYSRNQATFTSTENKQVYNDINNNNYPPLIKYSTTTVVPEYNDIFQTPATASAIKFPRVIDFTNMNPYFPNNNNNNRFPSPSVDFNSVTSNTNENSNNNFLENDFNKNIKPLSLSKYNNLNYKDETQKPMKDLSKYNYISNQEFSQNYFENKNKLKGKYSLNNDKMKKPWDYSNKDEEDKRFKSPIKYEYKTNHSAASNKYKNPLKRPFNSSIDEITPASSNLDFYNYQHPETNFGSINNYPSIKYSFGENDYTGSNFNYAEKLKPFDGYQNSFKNVYTTPDTSISHWGNLFKQSENSLLKNNIRKPLYPEENEDIVHIPKRPSSSKYGTEYDSGRFSDWSNIDDYKHYTQSYKQHEWPKHKNRYKSEEDLLGLRNHDLTHSSYPPSFKPGYNEPSEDFDYKKLVDQWKHNYLKTKHKDSVREYETYASETNPIHVPVPKPYPIEVPHPVIVPVPQPYPVHVPIPKPVAIPVIRELTVPIEKPVPYPVYKNIPYPIEKPVPVPVEKQVRVPIMKPYPVAVPQVRPLFHHTRPHHEGDPDFDDDDNYQPRPESSKRIPTVKRPKNKRQPPRRPSRMTYKDRDKRRGPQRPSRDQRYNRYSHNDHRRPPHRHHDNEYEEYEPSDYVYCKRTGNC